MREIAALFVLACFAAGAVAGDLPYLVKTPGAVRALSKKRICEIKRGKDERHVTQSMKNEVFALYEYTGYDDPRCVPKGKRTREIDHLISRELGGADDVKDLWPQAYGTSPWNAVLKDKLENRLNK